MRVDGVGFRRAAQRLRTRADLSRIDDGHRQLRRRTRGDQRHLIAAGRFDDHDRRLHREEAANQIIDRARGGPARPGLATGMHGDHEFRVADVHADRDVLLHLAAPRHRVSRPYACSGSWPSQLSGIYDDTIEKAPMLAYGLRTGRSAGYLLVRSICSRLRRHKRIRSVS